MKKLFLLLILSFFSTQGLAAGCPDGSEPVKSVSDDGTYFVFNCGGGTSSDSNNINTQTINPLYRVITSTDQRYHDMCNAFESSVANRFYNDMIRLYKNREQIYSNIGIDVIADLYGDGELESSSIQYSLTQPRLHAQNIKLISLDKSLNVDKTLGLKFLNEQPKSKEISKVISGDVNNDKIIDLIFIDYGEHNGGKVRDGKVIMLLSSSDGYRWSVLKTKTKNVSLHTGVLIDIDNDNDLDLVLGGAGKTLYRIHILENDGKGQFSALNGPQSNRIGLGWVSFTASDIDNDGYHDLIMDSLKKIGTTWELGAQIVWGGEYGLFTSPKITKMPYHHTSNKDILLDAITYENSGMKNILFIYAADGYQNGTKLINHVFNEREISESNLILHRKFPIPPVSDGQWVKTIYPCQSGLKFHTFATNTSQSIVTDLKLSENEELYPITDIEEEREERIAALKKKNEEEKAKRLAKDRENKKNNFKFSSRNFKPQLKLLESQNNVEVCNAISKEFYAGDYYSRTKKNTYLFVSLDSNGKDCYYEWASNEGNALRRCKQNNETDGKCTIYALGDNIVWGNPRLYKELTGRK